MAPKRRDARGRTRSFISTSITPPASKIRPLSRPTLPTCNSMSHVASFCNTRVSFPSPSSLLVVSSSVLVPPPPPRSRLPTSLSLSPPPTDSGYRFPSPDFLRVRPRAEPGIWRPSVWARSDEVERRRWKAASLRASMSVGGAVSSD